MLYGNYAYIQFLCQSSFGGKFCPGFQCSTDDLFPELTVYLHIGAFASLFVQLIMHHNLTL